MFWSHAGLNHVSSQKFREFLEGSNLITKLQAKHDLLKRTLGDGTVCFSLFLPTEGQHFELKTHNDGDDF